VTWVFLLKQKSEVSSIFIRFVPLIKNQSMLRELGLTMLGTIILC